MSLATWHYAGNIFEIFTTTGAVVANVVLITGIVRKKLSNVMNAFYIQMALIDIVLGTMYSIFSIMDVLSTDRILRKPLLCSINGYFIQVLNSMFLVNVLVLCIYQYLLVNWMMPPMRVQTYWILSLLAWIVITFQASWALLFTSDTLYVIQPSESFCEIDLLSDHFLARFQAFLDIILMTGFPFITGLLYLLVWRKLQQSIHQAGVNEVQQERLDKISKPLVWRAIMITIAMFVTWSLMTINWAYTVLTGIPVSYQLDMLAAILAHCNTIVNPIISMLTDERIRSSVREMLHLTTSQPSKGQYETQLPTKKESIRTKVISGLMHNNDFI
ncbi:hypothetical protein EDD86DRAFT_276143 [Gorgonomyces haynaldii]|nr:hypothetical protein EDD86DRAFT_276143 [Gorgonomyces haynaldii]